jgi:ribosomal protein S13
MYTNSFIKEQMACDEAAIKPALTEVVSKMEPCPKYNSLKIALKELAILLPNPTLSSQSLNMETLAPVVNAYAAHESVNDPQNAAVTGPQNAASASAAVPAVNVNPAPAATINDSEVIAYNGRKDTTSYAKIKKMLENTILNQTNEERKNRIQGLLDKIKEATEPIEVTNHMNKFGNFEITGKGANQYYKIGINGGTRKRRMRRVKTQRRRKNARTIKKKKITNNKSGKRN